MGMPSVRGWHLSPWLLVWAALLVGFGCAGGDVQAPPTTGSLAITTATSGPEPDADGYAITIDGGAEAAIGTNATLHRDSLDPGDHSVRLTGLAANCAVEGENPRSVLVSAGATADASFAITCAATTGSLTITTTTTGSSPDPDGYTVSVDGGTGQAIGINATIDVTSLTAGTHTVTLAGVAANCAVQGTNPTPVTILTGASATAAFSISCFTHWTHMASGTTNNLVNISGSSASNIFVVDQAGTIRHYDGVSWTPQSAPVSVSRVWAKSGVESFAIGKTNNGIPVLLHYDGQQWSVVFSPPIPPGLEDHKFVWGGVWGTGADVFAVGGWNPSDTDLTFPPGYVVHYDGTAWSSALCCGEGVLTDVWGSSKDDVYLIGTDPRNDETGFIMHKTGDGWSRVFEELFPAFFLRIWGSSASDVYVAAGSILRYRPTLYHFNGTSWGDASPPTSLVFGESGPIWGSSADDVYLLAFRDIVHLGEGGWKGLLRSKTRLSDIWGSSSTDVYAVGENGTILHGTP